MPKNNPRPDPVIPDHEVLRKIGGGSYGEVWLARGVTGALRAVKVVYREDFDSERSFEREFEGILKFEPISRDHPGLVNILHVGRSPDFSFYYYVMELGDDVLSGRDISPVEYEARTLSSDLRRTRGHRLETEHCIDCGLRLAEALRHLHESGLAHRDVKPSNVIFVNGRPKLADIGLVAARGQRTFVGTEGFVPPEGPGSAQADVYSLGKVLYEIATGKDRLDFPELPDELPEGPERKRWLALNQIICNVCEPQLSKRSIATAGELSDVLRRLQLGKRSRRRRRPVRAFFATVIIVGIALIASWKALHPKKNQSWSVGEVVQKLVKPDPPPAPPERKKVLVKITSNPSGARVYQTGNLIPLGDTPLDYLGEAGRTASFTLQLDGYKAASLPEFTIQDTGEPLLISKELKVYSPPVAKVVWKDKFRRIYQPRNQAPASSVTPADFHESELPVDKTTWDLYVQAKQRPEDAAEFVEADFGGGGKQTIVLTSQDEASGYCQWLMGECVEGGYLTERDEIIPVMLADFSAPGLSERARQSGFHPFKCQVRTIPDAAIQVTTEPSGAEVYVRGQGETGLTSAGFTSDDGPLVKDDLKPGEYVISLVLGGFKTYDETITLKRGEAKVIKARLKVNHSVAFDKPWTNSLDMRFVPAGKDLMASVFETRVKDYLAFTTATNRAMPTNPGFTQGSDHPIVYVSRDDCQAFCKWLTEKEQAKGEEQLSENYVYRLPTDWEWSLLAGLKEDKELSPARRESQIYNPQPQLENMPPPEPEFLWHTPIWPPRDRFANLADEDSTSDPTSSRVIRGYHDTFRNTAPVGSFEKDANYGLYDLCGNVAEWVETNYNSVRAPEIAENIVTFGVLRGGGWNTYQKNNLYIGSRSVQPPTFRDDASGFRVVLAKVPLEKEKRADDIDPDHG